jgi:hypothetical protein
MQKSQEVLLPLHRKSVRLQLFSGFVTLMLQLDSRKPPMSQHDQFSKQIEVLVSSHTLHGSESLCKLLRYLAYHALKDPNGRVKEYQIATEVFGRRPDFDPQSDSMIRVQAGRLRSKLSEYYSGEARTTRSSLNCRKAPTISNSTSAQQPMVRNGTQRPAASLLQSFRRSRSQFEPRIGRW